MRNRSVAFIVFAFSFYAFCMEIDHKSKTTNVEDLTSFLPIELKLELAKFLAKSYEKELNQPFNILKKGIINHRQPWFLASDYKEIPANITEIEDAYNSIYDTLSLILKIPLFQSHAFFTVFMNHYLSQLTIISGDIIREWFNIFYCSIDEEKFSQLLLQYLNCLDLNDKFARLFHYIAFLEKQNIEFYKNGTLSSGSNVLFRGKVRNSFCRIKHDIFLKCRQKINEYFKANQSYMNQPFKQFDDYINDGLKSDETIYKQSIKIPYYIGGIFCLLILGENISTRLKEKPHYLKLQIDEFTSKVKRQVKAFNKRKAFKYIFGLTALGLGSYGLYKIIKKNSND